MKTDKNQQKDEEIIEEIEVDDKNENNEDNKVDELTNQLKRALADYQNLEKRIISEKSVWIMTANKDLILRLLPGLDSLLLAEKHTSDEGVKMSIKHFLDIFESEGVKKIETDGKDFDPHLMEAVTTKEGKDGKVLEELKAGYMLNGDVIRPAQVIVGRS